MGQLFVIEALVIDDDLNTSTMYLDSHDSDGYSLSTSAADSLPITLDEARALVSDMLTDDEIESVTLLRSGSTSYVA